MNCSTSNSLPKSCVRSSILPQWKWPVAINAANSLKIATLMGQKRTPCWSSPGYAELPFSRAPPRAAQRKLRADWLTWTANWLGATIGIEPPRDILVASCRVPSSHPARTLDSHHRGWNTRWFPGHTSGTSPPISCSPSTPGFEFRALLAVRGTAPRCIDGGFRFASPRSNCFWPAPLLPATTRRNSLWS